MNHEIEGSGPEAVARQPGHRREQRIEPNGMTRGKTAPKPLFGPLQLFWLRAAQTHASRALVIGRRPSYDDCE